jgi:hypothetical protein
MALVSRRHREAVTELTRDEHVRAMFAELPDGFDRWDDWDFTRGALEEYQRRSGEVPHHIGAVAKALRELRDDALRLAREAEEANECPEGCGRPAHPQGGPCTLCWHRYHDVELED